MKKALVFLAIAFVSSPAFAIHMYAGSSCSNDTFELNYDGPGSNYAVGGLHSLSLKGGKADDRISSLAAETDSQGNWGVGEEIAEQIIGVTFKTVVYVKTSAEVVTPQPGDQCEADEYDYEHSEWTATKTVEIEEITPEAAATFGLKRGDRIVLSCQDDQDRPYMCPSNGRVPNLETFN